MKYICLLLGIFVTHLAFAEPASVSFRILIYGNHALDDAAILKMTGLDLDPSLSTMDVKRRLETSGLFSKTRVTATRNLLKIYVVEKTTWFVVPYISADEQSTIFGFAGGKAALFGEHAQALGRGQFGNDNKIVSAIIKNEFLLDSNYMAGFSFDFEDSNHYVYSGRDVIARTDNRNLGTSLLTGFHADPALFFGFNSYVEVRRFQIPDQGVKEGTQISHRAYANYGKLYLNEGLTQGASATVYFEKTNPFSDFSFFKSGFLGKMSPLLKRSVNWIITPKFEVGEQLPYYQNFEIGGAKLRGFPGQQFRDDAYFTLQNDLLLSAIPIYGMTIRPLVYFDWAFVESSGRTGLGAGVQAFLHNVAMPAVQIFAGYGLNPNGFSASAAIGPQF